jgi:beta-glucanase (GH16 family)
MAVLSLSLACAILLYLSAPCSAGQFKGWVDPATPEDKRHIKSYHRDHILYDLVMSDEFETPGRDMRDGTDPMWTAIDRSDDDQTGAGKKSLQFYNHSQVTTRDGKLVITTTTEDTSWKGFNPYKEGTKYGGKDEMGRHFKSGMVQSWNKFCVTGGILEVDVQFPGRYDIGGLWPAVWMLGNLGRATFESSTNLMWPWSYNQCDRKLQKAQTLSACDVTTHYSLNAKQGRGATEIDLIEVMAGPPHSPLPMVKNNISRPYSSMTLQLAPGIPAAKKRPFAGTVSILSFYF